MMRITSLFAVAFLTASIAYASDQETATGTMTVGGKTTPLRYAVAHKEDADVVVLLSNIPVSLETYTNIGEMLHLADSGTLTGVEVRITPEKSIIGGQLYSPEFKLQGNSFSAVGMHTFEPATFKTNEIAGKLSTSHESSFNHVSFSYSAKFRTAIGTPKAASVPALKGTPLPPGGGEIGKTYLAYTKSLVAGDIAAVRAGASAQRAKQMNGPDFKQMFPLLQAMEPKNIKITSGALDGDTATLTATGTSDGDPASGMITMVREGGKWKVEKESWTSKHH